MLLRRARRATRCGAPLLVVVKLAAACSGKASCEDHVEEVEACGWGYTNETICRTPSGRCYAACDARAGCEAVDADEEGTPPWELVVCRSKCFERFTCPDDGREIPARWACDGDKDCIDGADEEDCEYFECADGALIASEEECDEWYDCHDRSDELECRYFLCRDNAKTIEKERRCDGRADCADESDELDCP